MIVFDSGSEVNKYIRRQMRCATSAVEEAEDHKVLSRDRHLACVCVTCNNELLVTHERYLLSAKATDLHNKPTFTILSCSKTMIT